MIKFSLLQGTLTFENKKVRIINRLKLLLEKEMKPVLG